MRVLDSDNRRWLRPGFWVTAVLLLASCGASVETAVSTAPPVVPDVIATPTVQPALINTVTAEATETVAATGEPVATVPPRPTAWPTVVVSSTPDPIFPHTLAGLAAQPPAAGAITVIEVLETTETFSRAKITYESDGLTITGVMVTPVGTGPFPVVLLLHGFYFRDFYTSGTGTVEMAAALVDAGYLTIAPDFRGWGGSDSGLSLFHLGLVRDVVNLLAALPTLPAADTGHIGLWGHSMGGGIATKVLVLDGGEQIGAAVLHAPNSPDDADLIARWGPGCLPGQPPSPEECNPADVILSETSAVLVQRYLAVAADPLALQAVAPFYHLEQIETPVQIHIGTADGQTLAATPPEWSAKLADGLAASGKPVDYFTYEGEGHFFGEESWSLMAARTIAFFDARLRP